MAPCAVVMICASRVLCAWMYVWRVVYRRSLPFFLLLANRQPNFNDQLAPDHPPTVVIMREIVCIQAGPVWQPDWVEILGSAER